MGAAAAKLDEEGFLSNQLSYDRRVISDQLVDPNEVTILCLKQRLFTWGGDEFMVRTESGIGVLSVSGSPFSLRSWTVLSDANGRALAVCSRKVFALSQTFYIYGFTPRIDGQQPSTERHEGLDLFYWAMVAKPIFECTMRPALHVYMADRNNNFDDISYLMKQTSFCSPKLEITKDGKGCCFVDRAIFQFDGSSCYKLKVAPGVDTAFMVCLVLVKDEMVEASGKECSTAIG